jgi:hypothetical protein
MNNSIDDNQHTPGPAKFEPADGSCLFFIGQDLQSTGGLENYNEGYCDHFSVPSGFTVYTNFSPGGESYEFINKGNDGIKTLANWGAGDCCAQYYIDDPDFRYSIISIGLSLVNHEKNVAKGDHDYLIRELGEWIKNIERPVFLRIGYEFDGWDWNHYNKKHYLSAWKRIHSIFGELNVNNVAYVWQSKGTGSGQDVLEEWYPGDAYVDWCGYSYFGNPDEEMLAFARKQNKPVFIAEATPVFQDGGLYLDADLSKEKIAKRAWEQWFVPFINTLHYNKDVIKAFAYINTNWPAQPMWINNATFQQVDSRIQVSAFISKKWTEEISNPRYLKPTPGLFKKLGYE